MRFIKFLLPAVAGIVLMTGCVTTQKYQACLNDANALRAENKDLSERLQETGAQLNKEKTSRVSLEKDVSGLKTDKEELIRVREKLFELNKKMTDTIEELQKEKLSTLKEKDTAITEIKSTYDNLVSELNEEIKRGEIEVTQLKNKLSLSMVEKILFDSGKADIKANGKKVLERVAEILKGVSDKQIRVEGHTDNVPIGPRLAEKFPTNWELSTERATTVVRYLQENGVNPALLSAAGYSEYRPVGSNETEEGRAKNRRIEIVLIPLEADMAGQQ